MTTSESCPDCPAKVTEANGKRWCTPGCAQWGQPVVPPEPEPSPADLLGELDALGHARATDPPTSAEAAETLGDIAMTEMRAELLATYAAIYEHATGRGLTAEEAAKASGYGPEDGAWKRVSDLKAAELIADTGARRAGTSGRDQAILAITARGLAVHLGETPPTAPERPAPARTGEQPHDQLATDLVTCEGALRRVLAAAEDDGPLTAAQIRKLAGLPEEGDPWTTQESATREGGR